MTKILSTQLLIAEHCRIVNSHLGYYTEIGSHNFFENVAFGGYSYTGKFCYLQNTQVGKFANIAAMVRIGPTAHPTERPAQHHLTYRRIMYGLDTRDDDAFFAWRAAQITRLGHDTWIGHGAIMLPMVNIGNGAVVGAGAVVTKDVEPYAIVVGVPAKIVRRRFSPDVIARLESIEWWHWSHDVIKARLADFNLSAEEFVRKYAP